MIFRQFPLRALLLVAFSLLSASARAGIGLPERLAGVSERIAAAPTDADLYLRRALIYSDTGEFKLALADVDTAAQFGPVQHTYFVRGILLYRLGQLDQALPLFNQFIEANPKEAEALIYRARVLRDAGKSEPALLDYRRYFALQPNAEPGEYLTATRLMVELADQKRSGYSHRAALAFLDTRIAQLGNAPQLQRYAIEIEQQGCHSTQVLARLEQLHPNARRAPLWHLQRAEQHLVLGQPDAARAALDVASTLLDERRPSADKAQLLHRRDFLRELLTLPATARERRQRIDKVYRQYYPAATSDKSPKAAQPPKQAEAASHGHPVLGGFEQPHPAASVYDATWSEAVRLFHRCLRDHKSSSR